jgi:acetaldehyde dehydrogenase (acetylating)
MSGHSDGPGVRSIDSRVGDTVSRVFVGDIVSRFEMDAAGEETRLQVAEVANETIPGSEVVGGAHDGEGL